MAKNVLPVDFQDDILTEDMDGRRRYQMITNADGTVSFVDVTEYTQVGSNFGQAQINATNEAVNESADKNKIIDTKADLMANTQAGMIAGASAVKAAVSELTEKTEWTKVSFTGAAESFDEAISSGKYAHVPNTVKEIRVIITFKRNNVSSVRFSQYIVPDDIPYEHLGGYYNSEKYYASYMVVYSKQKEAVLTYKSWLKAVDNGVEYNNADTVQVDVYYR